MLMLSIRDGDYILIGEDIKIKLVEGGTVSRVGIEAPKNIAIQRRAVYEREHGQEPEARAAAEPETIAEL